MFQFLANTQVGCRRSFPRHLLHRITTLAFLLATAVIPQLLYTSPLQADQPTRPNIVLIMADDMGYGDISCFGNPPYNTPHLDQLAAEGMKWTDFHSNGAVCSPTRAALTTGRYQQRAGLDGVVFADPKQNRHHGLQAEEVTFAEVLSGAGYRTGVFGKWHLGYEAQYNPTQSGFDEFVGYVSGNVCYQSHLDRMGIEDWWHNATLTPEEGYCTHLITKHAVDFIKANKERPFCMYVAHECVHSPFQGPDDPPVREVGKVGDIGSAKVKDIPRAYKEMMTEMDNGIGQIVQALRDSEIDQNTLVFFFSDNGATPQGSNAPWKGHKGTLWEGGHRVPMIAWQPGKISARSVSDATAMTIDIMPTLLDVAKLDYDAAKPLDGVSLAGKLYDNKPLPQRQLFWHFGQAWAVRDGDWKLISPKLGRRFLKPQLFNLKKDPQESENLAQSEPDRVNKLTTAYESWLKEVEATATKQPE